MTIKQTNGKNQVKGYYLMLARNLKKLGGHTSNSITFSGASGINTFRAGSVAYACFYLDRYTLGYGTKVVGSLYLPMYINDDRLLEALRSTITNDDGTPNDSLIQEIMRLALQDSALVAKEIYSFIVECITYLALVS